jgi:hypothetical protein
MTPWKVIFATLVIFAAGALTGGVLVMNAYRVFRKDNPVPVAAAPAQPVAASQAQSATPWQARMQSLLRRMDGELDLTPQQHAQMEKIISTGQEQTRNLWQPITPRMNQEYQHVRQEMRGMLNPEQRRKFDGFSHPGRGNFGPAAVNAARQQAPTNLPSDNPFNLTNAPSPAAALKN